MIKSGHNSVCFLLLATIICFGVLIGMTGCGAQKLSADFDEAEVRAAAEGVIAMVNGKDSEGLRTASTAQMKAALTDELLNQIYEDIGEGGQFRGIKNMNIRSLAGNKNTGELAVVVTRAEYENRSFIYTISFDREMKLAGLYYK
ncbi:MAG: DUF3887 domain-containing protein [Firmicutes bacterium]|jgi:hypothetical protein|nr:DUF3887 domain-containing protein [Bacillota bacterium]